MQLKGKSYILVNIARILVGILFIFSGLIKANDPAGFGYKLQEYFEVFHLTFLHDYAVALAILLCTLEIVLGALLLLGFWSYKVAWGLLVLIAFFTFLTFYSAYFQVVTSCGCFGDAIPLTPWQSFGKDLVLLILIVIIFINRERIYPVTHKPGLQKASLITVLTASLLFGLFTYNYLPVIDFLPYKVGNNIPALMRIPPGAEPDEYQITYTLKNKKSGATQKMTDKEYLKNEIWKDESWEIIGDPENKLIKKGYEARIRDLKITDSQGTDYTSEIIENPYYNLVIVAWDLKKSNLGALGHLNAIAINAAENYNIRTVLLTANSAEDADAMSNRLKLVTEVFYADAVPLKSMIRANPGLMLLKNGIIVNKWHFRRLPSFNELEKNYFMKD